MGKTISSTDTCHRLFLFRLIVPTAIPALLTYSHFGFIGPSYLLVCGAGIGAGPVCKAGLWVVGRNGMEAGAGAGRKWGRRAQLKGQEQDRRRGQYKGDKPAWVN
ncbi:hypothetical protein DFH08DRAFT_808256 [Mycena albidolilacea]|uniref:Uncharacterized protein n=1 Tax=Mycena albidolilacea TaxID=1033008 RepID=A0AAD7ESG0_9AGAR|nr:hypothetical protein DFH08DRAFT_808256 [Mycena albidolilacea]